MSTVKFLAQGPKGNSYPQFPLIAADGRKFVPYFNTKHGPNLEVGDKAFLGKRLNNPHGQPPQWELWQITIAKNLCYNLPITWYGKGRYIFIEQLTRRNC